MMDSYGRVSPWIFLFLFSFIWTVDVLGQSKEFIVTDFGAAADERTDGKQAFAIAWKKACETVGGIVSVPKGTFFLSGGDFVGPCNGPTLFHIDGTLVAPADPILDRDYWITFYKLDHFTLSGNGVFDGNGASCWSLCTHSGKCDNRPTTLKIHHVTNGLIQGINLVNSKMFHLLIHQSKNVKVKNVHVGAPEDSPNTDGIHIGMSKGIKMMNSYISTGDDCVSIGPGCSNVNISGVWCGPGHGISIGSLGKYEQEENVSGITVRNCTLNNTDNGLRIKTWAPSLSSNIVSDVTFADIIINGVDNPIIIDQYYCPSEPCRHDGESTVAIKGVKFIDVRGLSSSPTAVNIQCSKSERCKDIEFAGLDITFNGNPTNALCSNVDHQFYAADQVPSRCS